MPTEVHITKAKVFLVVMNGCESWIIKKAEHQRIDAFKLWCWRRLLRVPLMSQDIKPIKPKGNQPWIFIGLMLKLQYFGYVMQRANSLEKTLMLGRIEGRSRSGWQKMRWFDGITSSMNMNLSKLWEIVKYREAWHATVHRVTKSWTRLSEWATTTIYKQITNKDLL